MPLYTYVDIDIDTTSRHKRAASNLHHVDEGVSSLLVGRARDGETVVRRKEDRALLRKKGIQYVTAEWKPR